MVVLRDATSRLRAKTTHHGQMMSLTIFTVNCFDMAMMREWREEERERAKSKTRLEGLGEAFLEPERFSVR